MTTKPITKNDLPSHSEWEQAGFMVPDELCSNLPTPVSDAVRFAPLRVIKERGGSYLVMTRIDKADGSMNNFSLAECQHQKDAELFASAPRLLRENMALREALESFLVGSDATKDREIAEMFGPHGASVEIMRNKARAALVLCEKVQS